MRVAYAADPTVGFRVNIIRIWERGKVHEIVSGTSGPKDYTFNHVRAIFDHSPGVARVLMVRGEYSRIGRDQHPSPPFLLLADAAGKVYDMDAQEVLVEP
jgi:hypothetical protein